MSRMGRFKEWLLSPAQVEVEARGANDPYLSMDGWAAMFNAFAYNGVQYTLPGATQEDIGSGLSSTARLAYKSNGVVFAVMLVRQMLFSEARFTFQRMRGGRPGDLWAPSRGSALSAELALLDAPWQNGTTGDLLSRMIQYADLAGNAFVVRSGGGLQVLRPDWTSIIAGSEAEDSSVWDVDAKVVGYAYQEGGPGSGKDPVFFDVSEVAHFAPIPDPEARFRGMSWLSPIVREVMADKAATDHKLAFFENGATPNLAVKLDVQNLDTFKNWIAEFRKQHDGANNAYKTMFLAAGADATVIGTDMRQLDFKVTQGAGETRIAAAGRVPPVIVGLSEGLEAATYSNYGQARRHFADGTLRPLWREAATCLASIVRVPADSRLWYDDRNISFLQEDQKDAADIFAVDAQSYRTLVDGGVDPDSARTAVASRDITLVQHTGLLSVQLQEPGATQNTPPGTAPASAGNNSTRQQARQLVEELIASLPSPEE